MSLIRRLPILSPVIPTTPVTGDYTVKFTDQRVEIDATNGNVIITLPTITTVFKNKPNILFKRIDTTVNTVTFVGTSSNYDNEGLEIGEPKISTTKIYAGNNGIWKTAEIEDNFADNVEIINFKSDLPTPSGGEIQLENKNYMINQALDLTTDSLKSPLSGFCSINPVTLEATITYSGTNAMFVGDTGAIVIDKCICICTNPSNNGYWNLDDAALFFGFNTIFAFSDGIGIVNNDSFNLRFCSIEAYNTGLVSGNRTDGGRRGQLIISDTGFTASSGTATTLIDVSGKLDFFEVQRMTVELESNQTLFDFDESLKGEGISTLVVNGVDKFKSFDGTVFAANSLTQTFVDAIFIGNSVIPNSTAVVKLSLINNTAITTILAQNANTIINANVLYTIDSLIERFLIQDICTFDNTGNTVDTTFNHGISDNDRILLFTYTGTLPAELDADTEYFVVNKNAADFQVSLTQGGAAVTFTDDGTGTLHYRHNTGVSELAHIIYIGNEDIKCRADGWATIQSTLGSKINVRNTIMRIDTDGTITESQVGASTGVTNTEPSSSPLSDVATLTIGQGNVVYTRNDSSTANIIVTDELIGLNVIT